VDLFLVTLSLMCDYKLVAGHLPSEGAGVPRVLLQLMIRPKVVKSEYLNTIYGQGCGLPL
jgi:hypothetical protein